MLKLIAPFLLSITGTLVARVLTALGMGFISYTVLSTLADAVVSKVFASYAGTDGIVLAFLNLAGAGSVLTILTSALVTRASLMAIKKLRFI